MTTRRGSPRPTCSTRSRRWPSTRPRTRSARERRADENTRRETRRGRKTNRLTERSERIEPSRTDVEERAARHLVAIEQSKNRDRSESSPPRRRRRARVAVSSSPTPPLGKIFTVEVRICESSRRKNKNGPRGPARFAIGRSARNDVTRFSRFADRQPPRWKAEYFAGPDSQSRAFLPTPGAPERLRAPRF